MLIIFYTNYLVTNKKRNKAVGFMVVTEQAVNSKMLPIGWLNITVSLKGITLKLELTIQTFGLKLQSAEVSNVGSGGT